MKITVRGCLQITAPDTRWFVVRVKPGTDDAAFVDLVEAGYDVYLPRRRLDRHNRRLRVLTEWSEPLMAGYIFVVHPRPGGTVDDWDEVKCVNGVAGILSSSIGPLPVPAQIVEEIIGAEFEGVYDETKAAKIARGELERTARDQAKKRFAPGKRFIVSDGPFTSFEAEVEGLTHNDRVKALVNLFGRLTTVEFDLGQLEEAPRSQGGKRAA